MASSIQGHFLDRINSEYQTYRANTLGLSHDEIYGKCYEIDIMVNIFTILTEKAETLEDDAMDRLLSHNNLIGRIYNTWLKRDDGIYAEIESHVEDEIRRITGNGIIPEGRAA